MIITLRNGQSIDTSTDLDAVERHVLQKLFLWENMSKSLEEFRAKTSQALKTGWNNSGPVSGSRNLRLIIQDLEKKVKERLDPQQT